MLQLAGSLPFHPYYITYNNPILASAWNVPPGLGYGEGLERAAEYLAQKPDAGNLSVYAYNGIGPFSYFFPGQTDILKKAYFWLLGLGDVVNGIQNSDYLVVYTIVQKQLPECEKFLKALETVRPEKEIGRAHV